MATYLPLFTFVSLIIFASASDSHYNYNDGEFGSGFTHVCDHVRFATNGMNVSDFAFCDKSLSYEIRAKDLVDRMALFEKVQQLGNAASGVPRLGLPKYEWWSEALHGVSKTGPGTFFDSVVPGATSFPSVILTASSFNESLWKRIGEVVSTEARAMHNLGRAGLTFWSPNINVVRDPRWGRTLETAGEDPFVVGTYAANYVRGLQDVEGTETTADLNSRPLKVSACCKHFAAYDIENWMGVDRFNFDAKVTEQDMVETFLKPFEMCVKEGDASSVMCSFNRINGIPTCADRRLMKDTIRGKWGLHGYIVSDCDSIEVIVDDNKWLRDSDEDGVAQVMKAGLDLDCGDFYTNYTQNAVKQGKVREGGIDKSLRYLYIVLMRLGFFDGSPQFKSLGKDHVCAKEHIELAIEAAREGIVLLKNDDKTLPLDNATIKSVALIGPHANATYDMIGNYAGIPCKYTSPLQAFSTHIKEVKYQMGCSDVSCSSDSYISQAMEAAKEADVTILVVGLNLDIEREGVDRVDLRLPGYQNKLIENVTKVSKGPVVLVILSAGGIDITFAKENINIKAVLWAGYPGAEGGRAIADVIFGKYNPGGRLPLTWHEASYVDMLPMTSMQLRPVNGYPGRTYKFFDGPVVYPFGYGLSYTKFNYKLVSSNAAVTVPLSKYQCFHDNNGGIVLIDDLYCGEQFEFEIEVENVGDKDGSEALIVYSKPPGSIWNAPKKQVIGFKRVFVPKGGSEIVKFNFNVCKSLGIVDNTAYKVLAFGGHQVIIGDNVLSFKVDVKHDQSL